MSPERYRRVVRGLSIGNLARHHRVSVRMIGSNGRENISGFRIVVTSKYLVRR